MGYKVHSELSRPLSQEPSSKLSPEQVGLNKDEIFSRGSDTLFPNLLFSSQMGN